jgi:hypothetical protein
MGAQIIKSNAITFSALIILNYLDVAAQTPSYYSQSQINFLRFEFLKVGNIITEVPNSWYLVLPS